MNPTQLINDNNFFLSITIAHHRKSQTMKLQFSTSLLLFFLMLLSTLGQAQVTNDNLNYQVRLRAVTHTAENETGDEEPTFLYTVKNATSAPYVHLLNDVCNAGNTEQRCFPYTDDAPSFRIDLEDKSIDLVLGQPRTNISVDNFDFTELSYEHDGGTRCTYKCSDQAKVIVGARRSIKNGPSGRWKDFSSGRVSTGTTTLQQVWRYTNGEKSSPLDCGTISSGNVINSNHNWAPPSGAYPEMGYPGLDVYYKFTVPADGRRYQIYTDHNFYENLSLFTTDENNPIDLLHLENYFDGTKFIDENLCPGTYNIKVGNRYSTSQGSFTLYIIALPYNVSAGSIAASGSNVCEGTNIPQINNTVSASDGYPNAITYKWQRSDNGATFVEIPGATLAHLPTSYTGLMPMTATGQDNVRFRRLAYSCGNEKISNIVTLIAPVSDITPGSINLIVGCGSGEIINDTYTIPASTDPGCFGHGGSNNSNNATGTPGPISYKYIISADGGGTWDSTEFMLDGIWNPDATSFNNPGTYEIRRIAFNGCGQSASSNTISIVAIPKDGTISGKVVGPSGIGGAGGPVDGVTITAVRTTTVQGGNLTTDTYTTMTDIQGEYALSGIYYGPDNGANFTVTPSKIDGELEHTFDPTSITVPLKATLKTKTGIDFIDETVFTFSGKVFQDFKGTECGLGGVEITLNTIVRDTTNADGSYSISIPGPGAYTIAANYKNHTISPFDDIDISSDNFDMNFEDTIRYSVNGLLSDGCNGLIGEGTLTFSDSLNCINTMVTTQGGQYDIELPARKYKVKFSDHSNTIVNNFFNESKMVDLNEMDTVLNFKFRAQPVIEIKDLPEPSACPAPFNVSILEQLGKYPIEIKVYEGVIGGCLVDTGFVVITDEISDRDDMEVTIPVKDGIATYQLRPGTPNLTADYKKSITIAARDTFDQTSDPFQTSVIVTGSRAREQTFTTVTPEIPLMILRDPPGDGSYSYVEHSKTIELATSFSTLKGGSVSTWREAKLGTQFEAGFLGFSSETEIWGSIGGSLEVGATSNTTEEAILSISTSERFSTSGEEDVVGDDGNVYVGAAMNLLYSNSDIIEFDEATCQVVPSVDFIVKNNGFATKYVYTEQYIRETLISQLETIAANTTVVDSVKFYLDQIKVWEQTLQRSEQLKKDAIFDRNQSFSANVEYESSTEQVSSSSLNIEFLAEINTEVAIAAGFEIAGSGVEGGVAVNLKIEMGETETETTTQSLTSGFVIYDDDEGDGFALDILTDPVYMTPVFKLKAGQTSCPWQEGTRPRDEPMLTATNPIATNVPIDQRAEIMIKLRNTSQTEENRTYLLKMNQESNPFGAEVTIGGSPAIIPVDYSIDYLGTTDVTVKIGMGQSNVFTYEGLEFELYSECDPDISETIVLTAFFQSPCSEVGLFAPIDDWVINDNNEELNVHIKDYDKANLLEVQIEYAPVGSGSWQNLAVVPKASLNDNSPSTTNLGTIVPVNMSAIPDGAYNIRLKLVCTSGSVYSMRARGLVDTKAPSKLGIPQPIDDIYNQSENDIISQEFNEEINCSNATVVLTRLDNDNEVLATLPLVCFENRVEVTPLLLLDYPGAFRVSVTGIEDNYGNVASPANWVFITPGYEIDDSCGPLTVSNNNANQDGISQSIYRATILESDGSINPYATIRYKAEESIILNEGFQVKQAGVLEANIEPCPDGQ